VRARQIEGNLQRLLPDPRSRETTLTPETLNVVAETVNGFPVLFAESPVLPQPRALLTVADTDAQYYAVKQPHRIYPVQPVFCHDLNGVKAIILEVVKF
jgi:hypothetical protein